MRHHLTPIRANLHGVFHKSLPPVVWVDSGDIVVLETLEVGWRVEPVLPNRELARMEPRHPWKDDGPALTGPVAVRGAEPGMTLEVEMLDLTPGSWGWTSAGGPGCLTPGLGVEGEKVSLFWEIDVAGGRARNGAGQEVPLRPFFGTIGLASRDEERVPGWQPHPRTGGNLDATVLGQGSSLFLPVEVPGALLSAGDGHAAQADGEVAGTAIECPMRGSVRLTLHPSTALTAPRARTRHGDWVTFGIAPTLDQAATLALSGMLDLLTERTGWTRSQALAWATTTVQMRITQMVNPLKGAHAVLPRQASVNLKR